MRPLLLAMLAIAGQAGASSLVDEGTVLLQRLASQGYPAVFLAKVPVDYLRPCTLQVYLPGTAGGGFFIGMGGTEVLDLALTLEGPDWVLAESSPDDLPVLRVTAEQSSTVIRAILLAGDMLHESVSDSALFMYALERVDRPGPTGDVPEEQAEDGGEP
jgi:hypothetical protein